MIEDNELIAALESPDLGPAHPLAARAVARIRELQAEVDAAEARGRKEWLHLWRSKQVEMTKPPGREWWTARD